MSNAWVIDTKNQTGDSMLSFRILSFFGSFLTVLALATGCSTSHDASDGASDTQAANSLKFADYVLLDGRKATPTESAEVRGTLRAGEVSCHRVELQKDIWAAPIDPQLYLYRPNQQDVYGGVRSKTLRVNAKIIEDDGIQWGDIPVLDGKARFPGLYHSSFKFCVTMEKEGAMTGLNYIIKVVF